MKPIRTLLSGNNYPILALSFAFALGLGSAGAETEEKLDKTFNASPGGKLILDVDFGSIQVTPHTSDQIAIQVTRRVTLKTKADEEAFLRERPITFSQDGNTLTIRSKAETKRAWKGRQRTEAQYTITVPAQFDARLRTAGGGIDVRDLHGELKADTSGGGLEFTRLKGPLSGHTSGGGIHVTDCEGSIRVNTSGGGIDVSGGSGDLEGHTSGGSVTVKAFQGPARVRTSGGDVRIDQVAGKIDGATSGGSVSATLNSISDAVTLATSGGSVILRAPEDAAFDLDASTSGGGATCDLPIVTTEKKTRGRLKGQVNGGGQPVILRSSGGSVQVRKL